MIKLLIIALLLTMPAFAKVQLAAAKTAPMTASAKPIASVDAKTITTKFAAWDSKLKTIKVDYSQSTTFEGLAISASEGRLFKEGNHIRLDTLEDGRITQSALTDKKLIKILDSKGKEITNLSWAAWQAQQPNKALFDFGNYAVIIATHTVQKAAPLAQGGYILQLNSAADGSGYKLEFVLGSDYFPLEITISNEGVATKTVLKNIDKNIIKESAKNDK